MQDDLFVGSNVRSLDDARTRRDRGITSVTENSQPWMDRAAAAALKMPDGECTGEDIRLHVSELVGDPHHHNAWGALINRLIRNRVIYSTGMTCHAKLPKAHARRV